MYEWNLEADLTCGPKWWNVTQPLHKDNADELKPIVLLAGYEAASCFGSSILSLPH